MRFRRWLPQSAFGQTVMLIGVLLLINQLVSYLSVTHYFIRPSYQQMSSLIATQVRALRAYGLQPLYEEKQPFLEATGVFITDDEEALSLGLNRAVFYQFISDQIGHHLGERVDARLATPVDTSSMQPYVVWIKIDSQPHYWIGIPINGLSTTNLSPLTLYLLLIGLLSVIGGWLFVRRLNRPLAALQQAATKVGSGEFPPPLPEQGTSELIAVTRAFNQMNRGIQQLEQDRALMTAGISHDLRTPLTRVRLAVEMLPDDHAWVKEGVIADTEDMNAIIDQFIHYARQDAPQDLHLASINEVVIEAVHSFERVEEKNIQLRLANVPDVLINRVAIRRVLDNLIGNALRYGAEPLSITTSVDAAGKQVVFELLDAGKGIPEQDLERMFSPFTQGDSARGSHGSGLGLAICRRIIQRHHGQIRLYNHPQGGLVAEFRLPLPAKAKPTRR